MTTSTKGASGDAEASGDASVARSPDFDQSLARGLAWIQSFDADQSGQTLSEVASRTGLTRATSRRLLLTLQQLGF